MSLFLIFFVGTGSVQVFAWVEYTPVIFVGDVSKIYSGMPTFHGYTSEFLGSDKVRDVCKDAANDGVNLDYCS